MPWFSGRHRDVFFLGLLAWFPDDSSSIVKTDPSLSPRLSRSATGRSNGTWWIGGGCFGGGGGGGGGMGQINKTCIRIVVAIAVAFSLCQCQTVDWQKKKNAMVNPYQSFAHVYKKKIKKIQKCDELINKQQEMEIRKQKTPTAGTLCVATRTNY